MIPAFTSWPRSRTRAVFCGVALATLAGCERVREEARQVVENRTPHETYVASLRDAGMVGTAIGRAWLDAAVQALHTTTVAEPPFRERGLLPPDRPSAVGYRIRLQAGQRLVAQLMLPDSGNGAIFLDLFRLAEDTTAAFERVASAAEGARRLDFEAAAEGTYVLRIQPELLHGGLYTVEIRAEPALAFPVAEHDARAIGSYYGAPRDGGARDHHGVDIFAPRGTPVIAAADGWVSSVRETARGGKVVWLRDRARGQSLYYAHLDSQLVASGARVRRGDTLGLVGNSGNARSTPPHLHFGIYRRGRGPLNPYPFIFQPREGPPMPVADGDLVGSWTRVSRSGAALRTGFRDDAPLLSTLPRGTAALVLAVAGSRYRVRLPDGSEGYIADWLLEPPATPLTRERAAAPLVVRAAPAPDAPAVDSVQAGEPVAVLARHGRVLLVERPEGRTGWLLDSRR